MIIQREHGQVHRKIKMRRLYLLIAAILLLLVFMQVSGAMERVGNKLVLYVKVARLYTAEPDGRISMPLRDVRKDQMANTWHAPRGSNRLHEGQDIFAPKGTPIYSATEGYVYNVGENPLGGQTVSVIGAGGRVYYYAHLDSYASGITEGDYVTKRTLLGYVGTTGNAKDTPPHLHFGVYTSTGAINPLPLIAETSRPKNGKAKTETLNSKKKSRPTIQSPKQRT